MKGAPIMNTLAELRNSTKEFLTPTDIAPLLGCNPYTINVQAKQDKSKLGFPVVIMGSRVRIPRLGLIAFIEGKEF
jgi:hypothetical protein